MANVRERTLSKLHVLLGSAALTTAACSGSTDPGYGVVDPMPPPARCSGPVGALKGVFRFEPAPNGDSDLILRIDAPEDPSVKLVVTEGGMAPSVTVKQELEPGGALVVRVTNPPADSSEMRVPIALACSEGPAQAFAVARWTPEQRAGAAPQPLLLEPAPSY